MQKTPMVGKKFGRLTVLHEGAKRGPRKRVTWVCACDCGRQVEIVGERLRAGGAKSCGCLRMDATASRSITHGHSRNRKESRELKSYNHAKSRCYNPTDPKYPLYGGRGIKMCEEWRQSFEVFYRDMGPAPAGYTIDRIDVNGDYESSNCQWASNKTQARHRTDNVNVEWEGKQWVLKDLAVYLELDYKSLHHFYRGKRKMPLVEAIKHAKPRKIP